MPFDRNVISPRDISATIAKRQTNDVRAPRSATAGNGETTVPPPDRWSQKLLKYIPAEALSLYLALDGAIKSGSDNPVPYLWAALAVTLVFNALYLWRIWNVERYTQIGISCGAL